MDFDKLYQVYWMRVYSYVLTMLRDQNAAEEVTQETFFRALKAQNSYKGKAEVFTWLCAIAKNLCMDRMRRKKTEKIPDTLAALDDTAQKLEDQEDVFRIHQVLHEMEEPYKEVFQLRVFGEMSFRDVGRIFGKTENWARVTYHRARLKIKERLASD
ncbi:MAG: RNA polymerase sigma factor [Eubacterium sp.]|jgi:RNA polymerase sigma-70 factor (ECF subfamily)